MRLFSKTVLAGITLVTVLVIRQAVQTHDDSGQRLLTQAFGTISKTSSENLNLNNISSEDIHSALPASVAGMELVFADEFDGPQVDRRKWLTRYIDARTNYGNQEAQYYVDDAFEFMDGCLRIRAEKRNVAGFEYTSGLLSSNTKFVFQYGYMEIRAKVPSGQGLWPAFWLLRQGPWPPEIDVFEVLGHEPDTIHMSVHYEDSQGNAQSTTGAYRAADFSKDFHIFAAHWTPTEITWYVDGVERYRINQNVPQVPMYVLINLAVGGNWPGYPDDSTPFPSYLDVDYVRIYQHRG
ncbi:MAG: glycoside hydrolase family 16 protein [Cyanothece sp. SIO1E1]|nr:glycoside hydrolase family 16 protein [Cyanothece sp. SIO1E1]